ncbi:MAG: hypothetical protein ABSC90_16475 [Acidimicrobiales bacterium]
MLVGVSLLVGDGLMLFTQHRLVGAIVVAAAVVAVATQVRRFLLGESGSALRRKLLRFLRGGTEMLLYLSPIAMLSVAYPIASRRLDNTGVGGVRLTTLLLASSVTVPWLTQAVCLPLFRAVAPYVAANQPDKINKRLFQVWPTTFAQCLPAAVLFAIPIELSTHWSAEALGTYFCLCVFYVAFAQSLIPSIVFRRRGVWAIGWAGVTAALLIAPALWFLPPLVGLATQLISLRRHWTLMVRPVRIHYGDVMTDVVRGLLLGAVLWSDKYFLFLKEGAQFSVTTVYVALLPAVLAYNYYFVRLAPRFDASIAELRRAMEEARYDVLIKRSRTVYRIVTRSLYRSALLGVAIATVVTLTVAEVHPTSVPLVVAVAIASWLAMILTLLCYKLDYIGQSRTAEIFSGCYLVGCAAAFAFLPFSVVPYLALIGFDTVLVALTLRTTLEHWRSPEYSLFWRHATAW